jgi:hypothetical protein
MSVNAFGDATLRGLGTFLAPLWNNGTLDCIDLHTYYDVQYAPMAGTFAHSSQANYDAVIAANGITAPIGFHATEFNFKRRLVDEGAAAVGLLTGVWDQLGVSSSAKDAPAAPVGGLAFPWNLFDLNASDVDYGLAVSDAPYIPTARGCAWGMVLGLLGSSGSPWGWAWSSADPRETGVYRLEPATSAAASALAAVPEQPLCNSAPGITPPRTLVAWQDRAAWSTLAGSSTFKLTGLPPGASVVDVYAWDGWRSSVVAPSGGGNVTVTGFPGNETYVFLAHEGSCRQWTCGFIGGESSSSSRSSVEGL